MTQYFANKEHYNNNIIIRNGIRRVVSNSREMLKWMISCKQFRLKLT